MPCLWIRSESGRHHLEVAYGQSVRDALDTTDLRVRAACGGTGTCGACVVQYVSGVVTPLTLAEYMKLDADERSTGTRLACQMRLQGDTEIVLDQPAPPSQWKNIPAEALETSSAGIPTLESHIYGVAVDLGTTHIRVSLWDRKRGQRIATRRGPNPQAAFGADVLNRMDAARNNPAHAVQLAKLARTAIVQAVRDILARDVGEVKPMLARIGQVFLVGNTAMLALLTGRGAEALVDPANWQRRIDCRPADLQAFQGEWYMPNAEVVVADPVAGFVGSDLVADLLATGLADGRAGSMLVDVGTNTEIALWDGHQMHVTAVPGGPAFEGVGIRYGMPAEPGAVCRVGINGAGYALQTVGGADARGFCGSGLADAIAVLLGQGVLKPSGRFAMAPGPEGFLLDPGNPRTALFGIDVDAFQRAKAALGAAMGELLRQVGMHWQDLSRLCVCGAFGNTLDIAHAQAVGLLPQMKPSQIELHSDASLAGCERGLLAVDGKRQFAELTACMRTINLSLVQNYEDHYIDHLRLRPIDS